MTQLATGAFRTVGPATAVPEAFVVAFYVEEIKRRISVARIEDVLYAFDDLCPCAEESCPLSGGLLTDATLMCQCHGSEFDVTTGAVKRGPASTALTVYEVEVAEGDIRVRA
jgi:nitrite reductase/ring-hydroxylating ferredoxin subunit